MKLIDTETLDELELPDILLWSDEFQWTNALSTMEYALDGALHIQAGRRLKGRPITLEPPDDEMAWISRSLTLLLQEKANLFDRKFTLVMGEGDSERQFPVRFRHTETAFEAQPVYRWQPNTEDAKYLPTLRFIEVEE